MLCNTWEKIQMEVADLRFDVTVAEIKRVSEKACSIIGFCSENEKAERTWDSMMKEVDRNHQELFLHILQPS